MVFYDHWTGGQNLMMCSGPFSGAQGHSNLQTRTDRRGPHGLEAWRSGISTFRSSIPVLQQHAALLQYCCWNKVPFGGAGGLGASGLDGPSAFRLVSFTPTGQATRPEGHAPLVDAGRSIPH